MSIETLGRHVAAGAVPREVKLPDVALLRCAAAACSGFIAFLAAPLVAACPNCIVGQQARQQVFEDGFFVTLLLMIAPFAALVLASLGAERLGRAPSKHMPASSPHTTPATFTRSRIPSAGGTH